jgi:ankyrin repeat protein
MTVLHYAAGSGSLELVKFLIDKGLDINAKTNHGDTPLSIAKHWEGKKDIYNFLIKHGAKE